MSNKHSAKQAIKNLKQIKNENNLFNERLIDLDEQAFPDDAMDNRGTKDQILTIFIDGLYDPRIRRHVIRKRRNDIQDALMSETLSWITYCMIYDSSFEDYFCNLERTLICGNSFVSMWNINLEFCTSLFYNTFLKPFLHFLDFIHLINIPSIWLSGTTPNRRASLD